MIRGVFFDLGGVLLRTESLEPRRKWERRFGLPDWGMAAAVFGCEPSQRASQGLATIQEIWAHIGAQYGLSPEELSELETDFWAGDRFDEALLTYVAALRPRYRTAIISNAWPDLRAVLEPNPLIALAFERLFISAELGIVKPDPRIFEVALREFGLKPDEAVFVDDMGVNVEAARALGMAGVVYQAGLDVPGEFAKHGIQ